MSSFVELPNEIIIKILENSSISVEDLISSSNVCQRLQNICYSEKKLWISKFEKRWPLAWKRMAYENVKNQKLENWRENTKHSFRIWKKVEEIFNSLAYQLYKSKSITSPILSSIFKVIDDGKYGSLIVIDELRRIIKDERKGDLTKFYYAKNVLYHVNYRLVSRNFNSFFKLPAKRQTLDKGIYYFAKGFYPENSLDLEYEEVSNKLDQIAYEVQIDLKTKYPNHSAVSIELFSQENPLENTKWSYDECSEIFNCIRHIMFEKHNYDKYDDIHDVFSNKFLRRLLGPHRYIAIIFSAVSNRLGVLLSPIDYHNDTYLLKWKSAGSENIEAIHPFYVSVWNTFDEEMHIFIRHYECTTKKLLLFLAVDVFNDVNEESIEDCGFNSEMIAAAGMTVLLFFLPEDSYIRGLFFYPILCCLHHELHLEEIIEIFSELSETNTIIRFKSFSDQAKQLLELQRRGPEPITPKKRSDQFDVKFATGMIVYHKETLESGVIIGWREDVDLFSDELDTIYSDDYKDDQPFYKILLSDGSVYYAAQENLSLKSKPLPIKHYEVGRYFRRFNGSFYVANEGLRSEYPDDEKVLQELLQKN